VQEALERCRYAGPAPVTIPQYEQVVASQCKQRWRPHAQAVDEALGSLLLDDRVAFLLGRTLRSGRCAMIFGPSGNGKSHLLSAFASRLDGTVLVPYALYAYGQITKIFDPVVHVPVDQEAQPTPLRGDEEDEDSTRRAPAWDGRWVRIRRPALIIGGELAPEFLELGYDPITHFYQAPIHLKAQGGVLVVDDFGRQKISPTDLLNRFVLSLERGRDNLVLRTGENIDVPFEVVLLFSTNLDPTMLADEAHLRRIPYKVHMPPPTVEHFQEILRTVCAENRVEYSEDTLPQVVEFLSNVTNGRLKGCLPRDVVSIIVDNAEQDGIRPVLTVEAVDLACEQFLAGLSPRYVNSLPSASS
jgi:SpoVK/Ycf46/Vps4 family AAA+-type ATPase